MWPDIGLCCGTVRQTSLIELIEAAAQCGFRTISATPEMIDRAFGSGATAAELKRRLEDQAVRISNLDALTREVPGAAAPHKVPLLWRRNWQYTLEDLIRMSEALDVPTINVTHFLGSPRTPELMAEGISRLARRAAAHGRQLALEAMPDTSLPDAATVVHIVQLTGAPNLGLMLDTWHLVRSGGCAADIGALPSGSLRGVQLNDRRADAIKKPGTEHSVSERSLPGEGDSPLQDIVRAIVANTPAVDIQLEVFSSALANMSTAEAAATAAGALRRWHSSLGPIGG
jgi:sugar phosphate isomerase/epimerase